MKSLIVLISLLVVSISSLAQQSIECQVARQQILSAVNTQAQARAQSQANAQYQAQREASQFGTREGLYNSGARLGSAIGGALGAEDPLQAQDRRIQEAIQQYKASCER